MQQSSRPHLRAHEGGEKWSDSKTGKVSDGHKAVICCPFSITTQSQLTKLKHKQEYNIFFILPFTAGWCTSIDEFNPRIVTRRDQLDIVRTQDFERWKINLKIKIKVKTHSKILVISWFLPETFGKNAPPTTFVIKSRQLSWKQSQPNVPVPFGAMCRTELDFQNGDCVLTMSSWGIRVKRLKYLILRRLSMFYVIVILPRICSLFNMRKLGNWHNATTKHFACLMRATVSAACNSRHRELDHFSSPSKTRMRGLTDCCKPLCYFTITDLGHESPHWFLWTVITHLCINFNGGLYILILVWIISVSKRSAWGSFYKHGLTLIPAWISNYIHHKVWDKLTYPLSNFTGTTFEVWEWISNLIPHVTGHVITYPSWD